VKWKASLYDKRVANFLKERRGAQTYEDFASRIGLSKSVLFRIENLQQSLTLAKLDTLCKRLRTNPEALFLDKRAK